MVGLLLEEVENLNITKRDKIKYEKQKIIEDKEILQKINEIQNSIQTINSIFDFVTDYELIDGCIYELNALYKKHSYYIKICKERDIECFKLN